MSTDAVAVRERTDWYQNVVAQTIAPHILKITNPASFRASAEVLRLGRIELSQHVQSDLLSWRTPRLIQRSDPENYLLGLITRGRKAISQRRNVSVIGAGDAVLFDTSHPYTAGSPIPGDVGVTLVHIPRTMIALPQDRLDASLGRRFTTRHGIGAVLRRFLVSVYAHGTECAPPELPVLERTTLELVSGLLAQQLDAWQHLPAETRRQVLLRHIDAFIDHHLSDLGLTPQAVAAGHNVSLRTLYSLFEGRGETVAAAIRRRRLERCHADLADPANFRQPVHEIGARWGFPNASSFSRAFRHAYGISPSSYRQSLPAPPDSNAAQSTAR
ncbi:helix-turn-helix domain-containing protein [Rhizohabitans arisaemae]|uniref:AraC-like ligand-binding domain-containing protein n=1 Tax=Rhizohabitans arisaemae TaxID=2720610 RepID=UPI0024B23AAC|nr:helix-turn-helix domain-containing protein [Rhizohabitans arisaemae]